MKRTDRAVSSAAILVAATTFILCASTSTQAQTEVEPSQLQRGPVSGSELRAALIERRAENLEPDCGEYALRAAQSLPTIGMTPLCARAAFTDPDEVNSVASESDPLEEWIYSERGLTLYFQNGALAYWHN